MSWVDIVIIVIVALTALFGLKKGLYKSLMSFFGSFLSLIVAFFLTKTVLFALLEIETVKNWVFGSTSLYSWTQSWVTISEGSFIEKMISPILPKIQAAVGIYAFKDLGQAVALYLSYLIASAVTFILLFIVIKIVFAIVFKIIGSLFARSAPGALSRLLGFVVGAAKGALYVVILLFFLNSFLATPALSKIGTAVQESTVGAPVFEQVQKISSDHLNKLTSDEGIMDKLTDIAGIAEKPEEPATP